MSEKSNVLQELRELRILRDMYQTRVDSKLDWSENKDKSLMTHYKNMLDSIKKKITKLENS